MRIKILFLERIFCLFFLLLLEIQISQAQKNTSPDFKRLENSHDLSVPQWGPYSKKYAGLTHIADKDRGLNFDFTVVTGYYRGKMVIPSHLFESDFHPWSASPDLNNYSFRQEIAWKDKIFADVSFSKVAEDSRLVKITLNNNTSDIQALAVNMLANISLPEINPVRAKLPSGRNWISGISYQSLIYKKPRPDDNLRPDGLLKGERRSSSFTNGSALADDFGATAGDRVSYKFATPALKNAHILLRYKVAEKTSATIKISGLLDSTLLLKGAGVMAQQIIPVGALAAGTQSISFLSLTNAAVDIDGFVVVEDDEISSVKFEQSINSYVPVKEKLAAVSSGNAGFILKYPGLDHCYGIAWQANNSFLEREIYGKDLEVNLRKVAGDNVYPGAADKKETCYSNIFIRPVEIAPNSSKTIYALVCQGSAEQLRLDLNSFLKEDISKDTISQSDENHSINPEGRSFEFSQQRMQATILQNIVFPIYNDGSYIRHFTPGKRWNSLYTWDSGFIGLGMTEIDLNRAIEILNSYTTSAEDPNAFVQHGSLVPVQFFLYQELWNKTQSATLLSHFYPRLKKYYLFFTGQYGSSSMRKFPEGLLSSFDYFYNSGGWDDYPAQEFMHHHQLSAHTSPVITTSMAIRIAKIMSMAAELSGNHQDLKMYDKDIAFFTKAIQKYSWDKKSGYFGYVVHDSVNKKPSTILKTLNGENYNKGLDGIYPLVAGICTPEQKRAALNNLFSSDKLWTPLGISAVDQSASYFSKEGYWNGAVWFPHQWFIWKTMLDLDEPGYANKIAQTALDLYKQQVDSTYNCYEIFRIQTGRGNGWHQFSGLSSPVLNWFSAYYKPGSVTTGFDSWIVSRSYSHDRSSIDLKLRSIGNQDNQSILVCMPSNKTYQLKINGKKGAYKEAVPGLLQISLPNNVSKEVSISLHP